MAVSIPAARRSPYAVFHSRSFGLLWVGRFISTAGSGLSSLAAAILVYRLTGSALSVGLMLIATTLPSLLIGLMAGVIVDRYNRKRVMIVADLVRAILIALVPVLVLGAGGFHLPGGTVWLYVLITLVGCGTQFFEPAFAAVLPELAPEEDLVAANALMQISDFGSTAIGFAGAGLIASALPIAWAFYLDAVSFVISAACIGLATLPRLVAAEDTTLAVVWRNLGEGGRFLLKSPVLRSAFVVLIALSASIGLTNALLLPFSARALHASSFQYSLQEAAASVGFVAASLMLSSLADRMDESQLMAISLLGMAVLTGVYSQLTSVPWALAVIGLTGFVNAPWSVAKRLLVQRQTPRELRGRVFSASFVVSDVVYVVGIAAAGLADLISVRALVLFGACIMLLGALLCLTLPGLRRSAAQWRRAARLLRAAAGAPGLGPGRMPTPDDLDHLIGVVPALGVLDPHDRGELLAQGRVYEVATGVTVVRQGDASDAAYFVLAGRVAVGRTDAASASDTPLGILTSGDFFGEIGALTSVVRTANVVVAEASTLLEVPAGTLRRLMRWPAVSQLILSALTARLTNVGLSDLPRQAALDQQALADLRTPAPNSGLAQAPLALPSET